MIKEFGHFNLIKSFRKKKGRERDRKSIEEAERSNYKLCRVLLGVKKSFSLLDSFFYLFFKKK